MKEKHQPWFDDTGIEGVEAQADANEERQHLKLVAGFMLGEDDAEGEARLDAAAEVFSSQTSAASQVIRQVIGKPHLRDFTDALIGLTGARDEFVELTDERIAAELGCSTKTVQRDRQQFRAMPSHTILVEIKEHWRDPVTEEPHPHSYRVHVTRLAVEAEQDARLMAEWGADAEARQKALSKSAEIVVRGLTPNAPRRAKKRRAPTDAQLQITKLRASKTALSDAVALGRAAGVDRREVRRLRDELEAQLKALDASFGFESPLSMQDTDLRRVEQDGDRVEPSLVVLPPASRMEEENLGGGGGLLCPPASTERNQQVSEKDAAATLRRRLLLLYVEQGENLVERMMGEGLSEVEAQARARSQLGSLDEYVARSKGGVHHANC